MKLISWNVNGLRAVMGKGFDESIAALDADVICLQETKVQAGQAEVTLPGYHQYWNYAEKKGYSGTAIFTRREPQGVRYGMDLPEHDGEGRVITLDMGNFHLLTVYTPNSQREATRLDYRMVWEDAFRAYVLGLEKDKPVILCGDMNVAHKPIDLKNPKTNVNNAGFTQQERDKMTLLLDSGYIDTFRHFHPEETGAYSWWSYMYHAREKNAGWRIDYFIVSDRLQNAIKRAEILTQVEGSDHCPVLLELDI